MLKVETEYKKGILFVKLKGLLNKNTSYKINYYINPVLEKHKIKCLVYDLEKLDGIDNKGIDAIINSKYYIKCNKGKIRLIGNNQKLDNIYKVLNIPFIKRKNEAFKLMEMVK